MRRISCAVCLFALLVVSLFGHEARMAATLDEPIALSHLTQVSAEITKINAYRRQIDLYMKRHPRSERYFAPVYENENSSHWKEYRREKDLADSQTYASAWMKEGRVVSAMIGGQDQHWNNAVTYYFRDDGTLAARDVFAYSFGMEPPYLESRELYSPTGKLLSAKTWCSNFNHKKMRCGETTVQDFIQEYPEMLYKKSADLPFYSLLGKGH